MHVEKSILINILTIDKGLKQTHFMEKKSLVSTRLKGKRATKKKKEKKKLTYKTVVTFFFGDFKSIIIKAR